MNKILDKLNELDWENLQMKENKIINQVKDMIKNYPVKDCLFNVRSKNSKCSNEIIGVYGFFYDQKTSLGNFILWNYESKEFEAHNCSKFEIIEDQNEIFDRREE